MNSSKILINIVIYENQNLNLSGQVQKKIKVFVTRTIIFV